MLDVVVIGAGPAGALAALRAADPCARTARITRDEFGGMAANELFKSRSMNSRPLSLRFIDA
jgi:succinate dehydrogenase/fumarate reductase flavoprotein subunit